MPGNASASNDPDEPVGVVLARLRRARRLTGGQLASKVGMSQPKISRLERGVGLPDPEDIARIAKVLGADDDLVRVLMDRAESAHDRMTDWRPTPIGLAGRQQSVGEWELVTDTFRIFEPAVVTGLLQTSGYAQAVLAAFQRMIAPDDVDLDETALLEGVSARVQRQKILADKNKTFLIVMAETVLRNRLCPPTEMLAQIERIRQVSDRGNVSLKFVPDDAQWDVTPLHGFTLLDDRLVVVDLFNTGLTSRGRVDARKYRQVFESIDAAADADVDRVLDKYRQLYLDLLRDPGTGRSAADSWRPATAGRVSNQA